MHTRAGQPLEVLKGTTTQVLADFNELKTHPVLIKALKAILSSKLTFGIVSIPSGSVYGLWEDTFIVVAVDILKISCRSSFSARRRRGRGFATGRKGVRSMAGGTLAGGTSDLAARPAPVPALAGARCSPGGTGMAVPRAPRLDGPPPLPGIPNTNLKLKLICTQCTQSHCTKCIATLYNLKRLQCCKPVLNCVILGCNVTASKPNPLAKHDSTLRVTVPVTVLRVQSNIFERKEHQTSRCFSSKGHGRYEAKWPRRRRRR